MYKYYTQRTRTDCLLTVAENFVQKPREKFNNLNWTKIKGQKYLKYNSFADILVKYGSGARLILKGTVELDRFPAIIGWGLKLKDVGTVNHALFWNGSAAICPTLNKPIDLINIDATYVFLHPKYDSLTNNATLTPQYFKNIKEVCKSWDRWCLVRCENEKFQKLEDDFRKIESSAHNNTDFSSLITLKHQNQYYYGDLNRANTIKF